VSLLPHSDYLLHFCLHCLHSVGSDLIQRYASSGPRATQQQQPISATHRRNIMQYATVQDIVEAAVVNISLSTRALHKGTSSAPLTCLLTSHQVRRTFDDACVTRGECGLRIIFARGRVLDKQPVRRFPISCSMSPRF
jgi:hypothetical protein